MYHLFSYNLVIFTERVGIDMDKKTLFNEALTKLVSYATTKGNQVTMEEVKSHFQGLIDDDSQYQLIYDYLSVNKIEIEGFTPSDENFFEPKDSDAVISAQFSRNENNESKEELEFVKMYMNDMDCLPTVSFKEQTALIEKLLSGDTSCTEKLIESKLKTVAEIAQKYRGKGVSFGDLIQEGNLELMIAISEYHSEMKDFNQYIDKRVENAIVNTINSEINSGRVSQHLADKLNQLDNTTKELSRKLGRVPELPELAEAMGISEDEASLLLKTSLDTLSVNEDSHITEDTNADNPSLNNNVSGYQTNLTTPSRGSDPLTWRKHTR